eukprot:12179276-Alexandrium_andersonii.AAC.1
MVPPPEPEPETVAQDVPALADAVPDTRLAAPAEQQASSSSAAAAPAPTVMQDLSQQFMDTVNPASGQGLPTAQTAVS